MKKVSRVAMLALVAVLCLSVFTACGDKGEGNTDGFAPSEVEQLLKDAGFTIVTSTEVSEEDSKIIHSIIARKGAITNQVVLSVFRSEADLEDISEDVLGMILCYKNVRITGGFPSVNEEALNALKAE